MTDEHRFSVTATWDEAAREGGISNEAASFAITHTGATVFGGRGEHANPEELLVSAVGACFVQTWAIFLAKLRVPIERPEISVSCAVEKDPAGGFRVSRVAIEPHVPAVLWSERRADVEKTLSLAERYCIVSKAVRGPVELAVTPQPR